MANKPIELLTQEQIKLIESLTTNLKDLKPIDCLMTLVTNAKQNNSEEHADFLSIYENQPEALLLYFASQLYRGDSIEIQTPINEKVSMITQVKTNPYLDCKQFTYLKHQDSDIQFDLTYIDTYQGANEDIDEEDETIVRTVRSYLYGVPYSQNWTGRVVTELDEIDMVINGEFDI